MSCLPRLLKGHPSSPAISPTRIQENGSLITILVIAGVFWIHRLIKFIYNICCYWEIHSFYLHALRIPMVRLGSWAAGTTAWGRVGPHWQVKEHLRTGSSGLMRGEESRLQASLA